MEIGATIIVLTALTAVNYWFRRSVIYPPFIFCAVWLLDIFVYKLNLVEIDPLHSITLVLISVGAATFSAGAALGFLVPSKLVRLRFTIFGLPRGSGWILKASLIFLLSVGVFLQFRYISNLATSVGGGGLGVLIAAREAMIEEANTANVSQRWFTYITSWSIFCALLFRLDRRDKAARIMLGVALFSCLFSTGRGQFLLLLSSLAAIFLIRSGQERFLPAFHFARWPVLAFLLLFVALMFTNKDTSRLTITPGRYVEESLVGYLCGSTAALDLVLRNPTDYMHAGTPPGTLGPLFHLAGAVGLVSYTPPPIFEPYVYVPFPINTFTLYKTLLLDYGTYAAMFFVSVLGFGHTLLYRKAHTKSLLGLYMFALSMPSVLLVFFVDTYSSLSFYAHAFLFGMTYLTIRALPGSLFRVPVSSNLPVRQIER